MGLPRLLEVAQTRLDAMCGHEMPLTSALSSCFLHWLHSCVQCPSAATAYRSSMDPSPPYSDVTSVRDHLHHSPTHDVVPGLLRLVQMASKWRPERSRQRLQHPTERHDPKMLFISSAVSTCLALAHLLAERSGFAHMRWIYNFTDSMRPALGTAVITINYT